MARDDFEGQSGGGGIVDFDFEVTDAWFGTSEAFEAAVPGANQIFMHWVGTTDLPDRPVLDEVGFHPSWKLGPDWEVTDGGKSVKYVGSGKPRFGKSYGRLCDKVIEITQAIADTDQDPLVGANHPKDARTWVGTKWHMDEVHYDFRGGFAADDLMPVAFLGKGAAAAAAPAATAPAATAPAATAPAAANGDLRSQVEDLARALPDYLTFQQAALRLDGVVADSELVKDIANQEAIYDKVNG